MRTTSKFKNKPVEVDGVWFPSIKQAKRHQELKMLERAGIIHDLKREVWFDLIVNGVKICRYRADHTYRDLQDTLIVEDTKGMRKGVAYQLFQMKSRLMLACLHIRVLET